MAGNQGFASMDESKHEEISKKGGHASGAKNLENVDRSEAGRKGAEAQSTEAKRKGGEHSHGGRR